MHRPPNRANHFYMIFNIKTEYKLDFYPWSCNKTISFNALWFKLVSKDNQVWWQVVLEPRVSPEHTWKYVDTVTVFAKTWTKGHWPLDDLWPHICWGLMCDSTQGSLCPSPMSMKIHQSMRIQWPFLQKNLNQRSLTPRWPLTPHLLRSHVWLYPRIILSKSHENTSKYVDTVNLFAKTWTKGHWPLDDLWPHICCGHMCDSTQGSLCPSPMKIHQSMWIQWTFWLKLELKVIDP